MGKGPHLTFCFLVKVHSWIIYGEMTECQGVTYGAPMRERR